jgi:hypothetical protein
MNKNTGFVKDLWRFKLKMICQGSKVSAKDINAGIVSILEGQTPVAMEASQD